jgi:hypothetical protein
VADALHLWTNAAGDVAVPTDTDVVCGSRPA